MSVSHTGYFPRSLRLPLYELCCGRGPNYKLVSSCLARSSLKSGVWVVVGLCGATLSKRHMFRRIPFFFDVSRMSVQIQPLEDFHLNNTPVLSTKQRYF